MSVRSVSIGSAVPSRAQSAAGRDVSREASWTQYANTLGSSNELFRGNWYFEPPGTGYDALKARSQNNFLSRSVSATWGLQDMDWWNRVRGGQRDYGGHGPSKYGSCAGMMTYTESFNKALKDIDPVHAREQYDAKTKSMTRKGHSAHDLQMVGKLQRGAALISQRPY